MQYELKVNSRDYIQFRFDSMTLWVTLHSMKKSFQNYEPLRIRTFKMKIDAMNN